MVGYSGTLPLDGGLSLEAQIARPRHDALATRYSGSLRDILLTVCSEAQRVQPASRDQQDVQEVLA